MEREKWKGKFEFSKLLLVFGGQLGCAFPLFPQKLFKRQPAASRVVGDVKCLEIGSIIELISSC